MIDLAEQIQIVSADSHGEIMAWLTVFCLAAASLFISVPIVAWSFTAFRKFIRAFARKSRIGGFVGTASLVAAICWAGVGSGWGFKFIPESGLTDAGSTVDQATGQVFARWTASPAVKGYRFKWFYSLKYSGETETRGPFTLPDGEVDAGFAAATIHESGWTALTITCYTEYIARPQVVTNGVYHLNGVMRSMDTEHSDRPKYVTPGIPISVPDHVLNPVIKPPAVSAATMEDIPNE